MGIEGKPDKAAIIEHFARILTNYSDMLILGVKGASAETRAMATEAANGYGQHIWEDLLFLINGVQTDIGDQKDEDFEMWANELKQS